MGTSKLATSQTILTQLAMKLTVLAHKLHLFPAQLTLTTIKQGKAILMPVFLAWKIIFVTKKAQLYRSSSAQTVTIVQAVACPSNYVPLESTPTEPQLMASAKNAIKAIIALNQLMETLTPMVR